MEDINLFEGLKAGDRASIEWIYQHVLPKVKVMIKKHGGTENDGEDMFQECLETILLNIDSLEKSLDGLIIQICKFKWIDLIRKNKTRQKVRNEAILRQIDITAALDYMVKAEEEHMKFKMLEQSFSQLTDLCQQLLLLIKEGKKVDFIVTKLAFASPNTYYRRKAACVERWSTLVKQDPSFKQLNI